MKEVSVEDILQNYNLIVPEIQREYVWGYNEFGIFETFIKDLKEGFELKVENTPDVVALKQTIDNPLIDENTRKTLVIALAQLSKPSKSINIGFLYSYKPSYYIGNDREEDLYLIDGQQRFTTLFLVLFYFAIKENRKSDFTTLFKFDAQKEKIAFDYRVRSITHQFIFDLITNSNCIEDLLEIRDKQWFLLNYQNDVTIKSIVGIDKKSGVFNLLFKEFKSDDNKYFDYVKNEIKFWHFKTEETSQGEELYITMNSRGQQLADNETIRAKLFDSEEVKQNPFEWSEKWELWQDFFWKNRCKKYNELTADEGFNEFLRWVQLLKMYDVNKLNNDTLENSNENQDFIRTLQWETGAKLDTKYLSLSDIEITFNATRHLFENFKVECENKISKLYSRDFEKNALIDTEWISYENGIVDQIGLFQLLPLLLFCKKHFIMKKKIDSHNLFRLTRIVYSLSKDETIGKAVRNQIANVLKLADSLSIDEDVTLLLTKKGISRTILNYEVRQKLELIKNYDDRLAIENLFWFAEDLRYNDGEIYHLLELTNKLSPDLENFNLELFGKIVDIFEEFIKHEDLCWGNLINTDAYNDNWDRIEYDYSWYKKDGLKKFITKRVDSKMTIGEFCIKEQKEFIKNYSSLVEIQEEESSKNQLYIYYILMSNNILNSKINWNWDDGDNFGKFENFDGYKSFFNNSKIFQHYKNAFRENENKIIKIQQSKYKTRLGKLLEWANN